jgi:hypothetical protein
MVESSANLRSVSMVVFPFKTEDPDVPPPTWLPPPGTGP